LDNSLIYILSESNGKKATQRCPCGYLDDPSGRCHCNIDQIQRYRQKISGPLLDRIDMHINIPRLSYAELEGPAGESSAAVRTRVTAARDRQMQRGHALNSRLNNRELDELCDLQKADRLLLQQAMECLQLSARAYHRILKVARTIADLAGSLAIERAHISEAINYRKLDRHSI
jgi:magnesium chelatase family protein